MWTTTSSYGEDFNAERTMRLYQKQITNTLYY